MVITSPRKKKKFSPGTQEEQIPGKGLVAHKEYTKSPAEQPEKKKIFHPLKKGERIPGRGEDAGAKRIKRIRRADRGLHREYVQWIKWRAQKGLRR